MIQTKKETEHIENMIQAKEYLNGLGIEDPDMSQIEKYTKFRTGWYQAGGGLVENVRGKIGLLRGLGFDERARKLLQQYHRINSGKGEKVPVLSESKRIVDLTYDVLYSNLREDEPEPFDKFRTLAEKVEKAADSPGNRALLRAYHESRESEFGEQILRYTETRKNHVEGHHTMSHHLYSRPIRWNPPINEVHEEIWEIAVKDGEQILQALYRLGLKEAPEKLGYLKKGITKEIWKESNRLARMVQNNREELKKFAPRHKKYRERC